MTQAEKDFEAFFWLLLEAIPEPERSALKDIKIKVMFSQPIQKTVHYAASVGRTVFFCLPRLQDKKNSIIQVIHHELAHAYYFQTGRHDLYFYQTQPSARGLYEVAVQVLEGKWTNRLATDEADMKRLGASKQFAAISSQYSYAPLEVIRKVG